MSAIPTDENLPIPDVAPKTPEELEDAPQENVPGGASLQQDTPQQPKSGPG